MKQAKITILISILIALSAVVSGCQKKPINNKEVNNEQNKNNQIATTTDKENIYNVSEQKIFTDKKLGISFELENFCNTSKVKSVDNFDTGKKESINVVCNNSNILSIDFISADYKEGAGEGCCFYYSGTPININNTNENLLNLLKDLNPKDLKKVEIGNRQALRFYSRKSYIKDWINEMIIIPYEKNSFSNIIINGPTLKTMENDNKYEIINEEYVNDEKYQLFENIIKTIDLK